jgi:hypothetical protein
MPNCIENKIKSGKSRKIQVEGAGQRIEADKRIDDPPSVYSLKNPLTIDFAAI